LETKEAKTSVWVVLFYPSVFRRPCLTRWLSVMGKTFLLAKL
jgi:hypothetical protein